MSHPSRYTELFNFPKMAWIDRVGARYFSCYNSGLQQQYVYSEVTDLGRPVDSARTVLDPNTMSDDGTVAIGFFAYVHRLCRCACLRADVSVAACNGRRPSPDGSLLAYGVSDSGSDWLVIRIKRVDTGEELPEQLRWAKFTSASWLADGRGFFYSVGVLDAIVLNSY